MIGMIGRFNDCVCLYMVANGDHISLIFDKKLQISLRCVGRLLKWVVVIISGLLSCETDEILICSRERL
jgi:hypothetical protein